MRALSLVDSLFLLLENDKQPMHVAGLCIFELPEMADSDFVARLIGAIDTELSPRFPFNQVLHRRLFWRRSDDFHLHHHCHYHRLKTGAMSELMSMISHLHQKRLARTRPLWELHLLDNLSPETDGAPKRFALYLKIHHALIDGVAAMRLFERALSNDPNETQALPIWARQIKRHKASFAQIRKSFGEHLREQLGSIIPVSKELWADFQNKSLPPAPPSILNQRIGTARLLAVKAFDKARFGAIAQHFNVSNNDVILAVCAGALRAYLLGQNALPDSPLIAFVPMSLRKNDTAIGNQISFIPTNLGTHLSDAKARLQLIHHSMNEGKARFLRLTTAQIINHTALSYGIAGLNLATRAIPTKQAFNLIISNVPGDDLPLYLNGARLTATFPASVLLDGQALNISFTNYQNRIDFGITACQSALPNIQTLTDLLQDALMEFENLLG